MEKKNTERKLSMINLTLGIIIGALFIAGAYFYTPVIAANTWKIDVQNQINRLDEKSKVQSTDIEELKKSGVNSEKMIFEMQFNLRNYLQSKGFPYITNPQINKSSKE